jgi:hypothetical protein
MSDDFNTLEELLEDTEKSVKRLVDNLKDSPKSFATNYHRSIGFMNGVAFAMRWRVPLRFTADMAQIADPILTRQ